MIPIIVTGDDVAIPIRLKKGVNGLAPAPFAISGTGVVKARLVSTDHKTVYTAEVAQVSAAPGADWANSLVVVQFAQADTADVKYQGKARVEVQVDDGGKTTWWHDCEIKRGNIA